MNRKKGLYLFLGLVLCVMLAGLVSAANTTADFTVPDGNYPSIDILNNNGTIYLDSENATYTAGNGWVIVKTGVDGNIATEITLINATIDNQVVLPRDGDILIKVNGTSNICQLQCDNNNSITIKGTEREKDILNAKGFDGWQSKAGIATHGNLILENVTVTGEGLHSGTVGGANELYLKNATVKAPLVEWMSDGGVSLINSYIYIEGEEENKFWTEKLTMDTDSVIYVGNVIWNYGHIDNGFDSIKYFLPAGYQIVICNNENTDIEGLQGVEVNTILDPKNKLAKGFWLKYNQNSGQEGDGGSSDTGNTTPDGETTTPPPTDSTTPETPWYQSKFAASAYFSTVLFTAQANDGGTITPAGRTVVPMGASITYRITPDEDHIIEDVLVDGKSVGPVYSYTFEKVWRGHKVLVRFAEKPAESIEVEASAAE